MSVDTYKKLLDNLLTDFTPSYVSLHRDGEPLLNKELEGFVEYTVSKGIKAITSSNCTLLSEERAEGLLKAGLSLIKTDFCADRTLFEELRAGADWDQTYEGMLNILSISRKLNKKFQLNITDLSTHNVPEEIAEKRMCKLKELFSDFRRSVIITRVHFHNALGESHRLMTQHNDNTGRYTLCHHPWVHVVVDFKGNVVPCCRDLRSEYICGNLLDNRMKDVWNNDRFINLRTALKDKEPEKINICAKCDLPYMGSYSGSDFSSRIKNLLFSRMWKR